MTKGVVCGCRCVLLAAALAFSGCTVSRLFGEDNGRAEDPNNPRPANYKSDILAMMRVYFHDPTEIRDASVSEPMPQTIGSANRYVVCLRLNAKKKGGQYSGGKEYVAVFVGGRLDQMIEARREQCSAAEYQPFPEAERLTR